MENQEKNSSVAPMKNIVKFVRPEQRAPFKRSVFTARAMLSIQELAVFLSEKSHYSCRLLHINSYTMLQEQSAVGARSSVVWHVHCNVRT